MTTIQAVTALGNGVHVGVMRAIIRLLRREGSIEEGDRYGSAYSGVDMVAAAMDAELGCGGWIYVFAAESHAATRRGLVAAWACRGLDEKACYWDAREAVTAPAVDVWVLTAECCEHSTANRHREVGAELASLEDISKSMGYIKERKPRVVIIENVTTPYIVLGITALCGDEPGYTWRTARLDPWENAGEPIRRARQFWVGVRACD
jgi:hypothetical protein